MREVDRRTQEESWTRGAQRAPEATTPVTAGVRWTPVTPAAWTQVIPEATTQAMRATREAKTQVKMALCCSPNLVGAWSTCQGTLDLREDGTFSFTYHSFIVNPGCEKSGTFVVEDDALSLIVESPPCEALDRNLYNLVIRDDYLVLVEFFDKPVVAVSEHVDRSTWQVAAQADTLPLRELVITSWGDPNDPNSRLLRAGSGRSLYRPELRGPSRRNQR